jgi:hypothetical protein
MLHSSQLTAAGCAELVCWIDVDSTYKVEPWHALAVQTCRTAHSCLVELVGLVVDLIETDICRFSTLQGRRWVQVAGCHTGSTEGAAQDTSSSEHYY